MAQPEPRRYIGTFHKTGTALFEGILVAAQESGLLVPWFLHEGAEPGHWDVAFDYQSKTLVSSFDRNPATSRYVVCIRDPRDLIVSAAYYHCNADEAWLRLPDQRFGGMTYQDKINSFATMTDRFLFEMEYSSYWQIQEMLLVPFDAPSFHVTQLEKLVADHELWEFHRIFTFLQFDIETVLDLMKIALKRSLFHGQITPSVHIRSGKPAQYLTEFDDRAMARYEQVFGDAAVKLGYPA